MLSLVETSSIQFENLLIWSTQTSYGAITFITIVISCIFLQNTEYQNG